MRERAPGVWELIVEAGRDPVTGRRRQVSRIFHGSLRDAKLARAQLLVEVGRGRHTGAKVTLDHLHEEWILELRRKGRSPNTIDGYEKVYRRNISPTLGSMLVTEVTTKTLTDLYRAHQDRGLSPRSVYQIHACLSSMLTQACRWGWRESNPAQWAEPPSIPNDEPVVPRPEEVLQLIEAAKQSRRPEHARAMFVAATTGVRRAELCALRRSRDVDWEKRELTVSCSILDLARQPVREIPTKNRRTRRVALDEATLSMLAAQVEMMSARAAAAGMTLDDDAYLFSHAADGTVPWNGCFDTRHLFREPEVLGQADVAGHRASRSSSSLSRSRSVRARAVKSLSARTRSISAARDSTMRAFTLVPRTRATASA